MKDFFEDPLIQLALRKSGGGGGGSSIDLDALSVTQNGTYTPQSGHAYDEVNVNVPQPEEAFLEASYNGTFYPDEGSLFNGVRVACPEPKEEDTLNANANGQYTPQSGHVYSEVNVNVPGKTEDTLNANANGQYTPESGHVYSEVNVNVPAVAPTPVEENDVIFIDYDGTIVAAYSAAEFAQLSALPANPSHTGLVAQGWNWTLSDAQTYVAKYGALVIGQNYDTSDGRLEIDIKIDNPKDKDFCVHLSNPSNTDRYIVVDWGDGSQPEQVFVEWLDEAYPSHVYQTTGDYTIKFGWAEGDNLEPGYVSNYRSSNGRVYEAKVRRVRIGSRWLAYQACFNCAYCESVSLHRGAFARSVDNPDTLQTYNVGTIAYCSGVRALVIPPGPTSINESACYNASNIEYISLPKSVVSWTTNTGSGLGCFAGSGLKRLNIPEGVTGVTAGTGSEIRNMVRLSDVVIPDTFGVIDSYTFDGDYNLRKFRFASTGSTTSVSNLPVPFGNTSAPYNVVCEEIKLPEGVTTVGARLGYYASALRIVDIPSTVTSIGGQFCSFARYVAEVHVRATTPPSLGSGAFGQANNVRIYVPAASVDAYKTATNWSAKAEYIQAEPA